MKNITVQLLGGLIVFVGIVLVLFRSQEAPVESPSGLPVGVDAEQAAEYIRKATGEVDGERIAVADREPGNWLAHGRTYDEQRFSPLTLLDDRNVARLGLAWYFDTDTKRGMEATPIVVDGVMYTTGSWSVVFAHNAKSGELIWRYDPEVPKAWGANACCDVVNRGVALWRGRLYLGALDGRLVALDAATGEEIWSVNTIDRSRPYTITGAPRVVHGKVIIGNGGAEYGVRGYVTAYDAMTGEQLWRFHTVPGNPGEPFESDAMAMAAATWHGDRWWQMGGGGTVWDSMAYDPELNLLYIGTGNGSPWNREVRSPGGGDNLFLSSIVALDPDTGRYVWHYQTTPGDSWDYTATQHMILTDLTIDGRVRKVLMQAPKNGFFYVLDRTTGELISAEPYIPITWATHVDPATGRPIETPNARYQAPDPLAGLSEAEQIAIMREMDPDDMAAALHKPSPFGGHNWQPMSYSPLTGLVYIPALDIPFVYGNEPAFEYRNGRWNLGVETRPPTGDPQLDRAAEGLVRGYVGAWDPVSQREVWRIQHAGPWNGGVLTTAGNLLFQGTSHGRFVAYRADTGKELWSAEAGTGIIAPPVTYVVDGEQYVTVVAGWGGAFALSAGGAAERVGQKSVGRILTYKLGGSVKLPPPLPDLPLPRPIEITVSDEEIAHGKVIYHRYCGVCHGPGVQGGGVIPDLRYMLPEKHLVFEDIVLRGAFQDLGMVGFADVIDKEDARAVQGYILSRAHALYDERDRL